MASLRVWSLALLAICLPRLAQAFKLEDDFAESLHLRPLPSGHLHSHFTFTLSSDRDPFSATEGHSHQLLPSSLLSTIHTSPIPIRELHLALNKGRWDYDRWGMTTFLDGKGKQWGSSMVGNGAEVWVQYDEQATIEGSQQVETSQVDAFHSLLASLSGQFCSTLAASGSREAISRPSKLSRGLYGSDSRVSNSSLLHVSLSPYPCTEVLHPLLALLPCKSAAGLASLLDPPHKWLEKEWHGLELIVKRRGSGWVLEVTVGSVWNGVREHGDMDFDMVKVFGKALTKSCPLASSSFVSLLKPERSEAYRVEPVPYGWTASSSDEEAETDSEQEVEVPLDPSTLSRHLASEGEIIYPTTDAAVAGYLSTSSSGLDVSLSYPLAASDYRRAFAQATLPGQSLSVKRSFVSSDQLSGHLILTLKNPRPDMSRTVIYRDALPWYLSLILSQATFDTRLLPQDDESPYIRFGADNTTSPIRSMSYHPASIPRSFSSSPNQDDSRKLQAVSTLEMELILPPAAIVEWKVPFTKQVLRYEEYGSDPNRGLEIGCGTIWEVLNVEDLPASSSHDAPRIRKTESGVDSIWKTEVALIEVAVPDFSMPYNVIIFTSTLLALFAGSALNLLTRVFKDLKVAAGGVDEGVGEGEGKRKENSYERADRLEREMKLRRIRWLTRRAVVEGDVKRIETTVTQTSGAVR